MCAFPPPHKIQHNNNTSLSTPLLSDIPNTITLTTNSMSQAADCQGSLNLKKLLPTNSFTVKADGVKKKRRTTTAWKHSAIVAAMLTGNTNTSCDEALRLHLECLKSNSSDDNICEAATRHLQNCIERFNLDIAEL
jgi:hypothetical protein